MLRYVSYARKLCHLLRTCAVICSKCSRSISGMSKRKKTKLGRESFTEDGINFWRDPKSPNGNLLAQYRLSDGTKKTVGCGASEIGKAFSTALKKREKHEQQLAGTDGNKPITVDVLCEAFLKDRKAFGLKKDTRKMLSAMTNRIRGYRLCYCKKKEGFVKTQAEKNGQDVPKLIDGSMQAHELTQDMFDLYIDAMHKKVLADGTLRSLIGRLRTMYEWANKQGYATPDVDFGKWNRKVSYSPMRSRKLDDDEVDKILHWLKHDSKRGKHNYYRYLFCTEIGLRISEVCSIKIADVDIVEKTVRLARAKKGSQVLDEVKITDHLADELPGYLSSLPSEQVHLFQSKKGGPMRAGSEWFRHACKKCEIDDERGKVVLHSARSKFITDQINEGRSLPKIMGSVGHKRVSTTMRYLQITAKDSQVEAIDLANKRRVTKNAKIKALEAELEAVRAKLKQEMSYDELIEMG